MAQVDYTQFSLVDATLGSRLVLGFQVPAEAIQKRLRAPWKIGATTYHNVFQQALGMAAQPNLMLVFNDLILNQDGTGRVQADASARYLGFNIPATNPETGEYGMFHFRIFTGNPHSIPGRYYDALYADVRRESRVVGDGSTSTVTEYFRLDPQAGGTIELRLEYRREHLMRLVEDRPTFPVYAALDPRILRVYQEDTLSEVVKDATRNIDQTRDFSFCMTVPEMADLFDGSERLVMMMANPVYGRKTFSSGAEYAQSKL